MFDLIGVNRYKIFSLISQMNDGITLSTISRLLDLTPQEVKRNLQILEELKLVDRNMDGSYYITVVGKIFAYFLNGYTKLCTVLEEGGYKDILLPCQTIKSKTTSKKINTFFYQEEQDADATDSNTVDDKGEPQCAPDCLEWPLCPLLLFGRANVGFVKLYNGIMNLLQTAERKVKICIMHADLFLLITNMLKLNDVNLLITVIYPSESSENSSVSVLNKEENINLIAVPSNKILFQIKGSIILSEKYGIYIPLSPRREYILFFIEGESHHYIQHLENLMTQLFDQHVKNKDSVQIRGYI